MQKQVYIQALCKKTNSKSGFTSGTPLKNSPDNSFKSSRRIQKIVRKTFSYSQKLQFSISFVSIFTFFTKAKTHENTLRNNILHLKTASEISFFEMLCPSLFKKNNFQGFDLSKCHFDIPIPK